MVEAESEDSPREDESGQATAGLDGKDLRRDSPAGCAFRTVAGRSAYHRLLCSDRWSGGARRRCTANDDRIVALVSLLT